MENLSNFLSRSLSHHVEEETRDDDLEERIIEATFEKSLAFLEKVKRRLDDHHQSLHALFLEVLKLFVDGKISDERSLHRIITGNIFRAHPQLAREYTRDFVKDVQEFNSSPSFSTPWMETRAQKSNWVLWVSDQEWSESTRRLFEL